MKHINTFSEGLDFDTSKNKRSNATYYDALDLRIISDDALSNGALVNFKGTKAKIDLFSRDKKLLGYCQIRNTLVLFLLHDDGVDNYSEIYKVELDESTDLLVPTLVYSDELSTSKLGFTEDMDITAIGRYEASTLQKVYWIDGINQLRLINISDTYLSTTEASSFDSIPPNDLSGEVSTTILNGSGNYNSGVVFYAYQFYNKNGADGTIYRDSAPVKLSKYASVQDGGSDIGTSANCSVKVSIDGISSSALDNYNRIRLYSVFYDNTSSPVINIVAERELNSDSITIIDIGNSEGTLDSAEFSSYKETTYVSKTIETKDNILFQGNISEETFTSEELDKWDARVYRFTDDPICRIWDETNTYYIDLDPSTFKVTTNNLGLDKYGSVDVPYDFACRNWYNDVYTWDLVNRNAVYNFKYQNNGDTLGGSGKNISYTFERKFKPIDNSTLANNYNVRENKTFVVHNQDDMWGTVVGDYDTFAIECEAGEVYRVGIKFFNSKGQSSYVKWIGDILWEEVDDEYNDSLVFNETNYIAASIHILNITVDHTNLPSDVTAYQIVRANRTSIDRVNVANGILRQSLTDGTDTSLERADTYYSSRYGFNTAGILEKYDDTRSLFRFISPDTMFNNGTANAIDSYKLRVYNKTGGIAHDHEYGSEGSSHEWGSAGKQNALAYKAVNIEPLLTTSTTGAYSNLVGISDYKVASPVYAQDGAADSAIVVDGYNYLNQQRYFYNEDDYGAGCTCYVLSIDDTLHIENEDETGSDGIHKFFYASLIANTELSRYGGISYADIQNTQYIPFSKITQVSGASSSALCVYGDSYTNMFYFMEALFYDSSDKKEGAYALAAFPVQSTIDLRKRSDRLLSYVPSLDSVLTSTSNEDTMHPQETVAKGIELFPIIYDESIGDLYTYNTAYSVQNTSSLSYSKPNDFVDYGFNDTKVIASDKKVNTEDIDSWTNFGSNEFIEVDSKYGPLNSLQYINNRMYYFQDNAFGVLAINDRSLISGDSNTKLALGTGGVLERFDYINTNIGAYDKSHIIKTKNNILFIDVINKGIFDLSGSNVSLSMSKNVNSFIKSKISEVGKDSIIALGYDPDFNEVLFTINGETICYNDNIGRFTSKYSTAPLKFVNINDRLMSYIESENDQANDYRFIYQHNLGEYGELYSEVIYAPAEENDYSTSYVSLLINPNGVDINSFSNIDYRVDAKSNKFLLKYVLLESSTMDLSSIAFNYSDVILYEDDGVTEVLSDPYVGKNPFYKPQVSYGDNMWPHAVGVLKFTALRDYSNIKVSVVDICGRKFKIIDTSLTTGQFLTYNLYDRITELYDITTFDYPAHRIKYYNSYIPETSIATNISDNPLIQSNSKNTSSLITGYRTEIPLTSNGNKFVDSYIVATFEFDNRHNIQYKLHDVITDYYPSKR